MQRALCRVAFLHDGVTVAQAIGGPDIASVPLWTPVSTAIKAVLALNSDGRSGMFYVSGGLAGRMQTMHAELPSNDLLSTCPDGRVEILYRPNQVQPVWALRSLQQRLSTVLVGQKLTADLVTYKDDIAVVVKSGDPINNLAIADPTPVLVTISQESPGMSAALDYVNNWPITSTRDLVRLFSARAAHGHDYDLRQGRRATSEFLLNDVLGRQLR